MRLHQRPWRTTLRGFLRRQCLHFTPRQRAPMKRRPAIPSPRRYTTTLADRGEHRRAPAYPHVLENRCHATEQHQNKPIEADHGRLKPRPRPMRGLKRRRSAGVISAGHAFVQTSTAATMNSAPPSIRGTGFRTPSANSPPPFELRLAALHPAHHAATQPRLKYHVV
jgi:hypothetical protein